MMNFEDNKWKLDRRIPIAVIVTLAMQIIGALIWATELDARVSSIEQQSVTSSTANEKFARLEERLDGIRENVDSMKRQLEHLTEHLLKP
jgi:Tfp pilus assembly protein PilO